MAGRRDLRVRKRRILTSFLVVLFLDVGLGWFGLVWIQSGGCSGWGLVWCDSARCLALAFVRFLEIETALFGMDWVLLCVGQTGDEMRYLLGIDCNEMMYVRLLD